MLCNGCPDEATNQVIHPLRLPSEAGFVCWITAFAAPLGDRNACPASGPDEIASEVVLGAN